ncbi:hypothetical protein MESS4_550043 [Mesorhizobium sp. STM 4661]|nr:hypothetical protein MESS4_550043 [Mesorhizobium sp. STM 4661]
MPAPHLRPDRSEPGQISRHRAFAFQAARAEGVNRLREDGDGDLSRACGTNIEADRRVDAGDLIGGGAQGQQALDALGVCLAAAERTDIETVGVERRLQREIVDLRIMGDSGKRRVAIQRLARKHILRPFCMQRDIGKTVRRGEGRARIDDLDGVAGDFRHRRQCLTDVDSADHHQARLRQMGVEEECSPFGFDRAGIARAKRLGDRGSEIAGDLIALAHDTVAAVAKIGDQDRRAAGSAFGIQRFQGVRIHQKIFRLSMILSENRFPLFGIMPLAKPLDIDLYSATAGQADLPGGFVGNAEFQHLRLA